MAILRNSWSTLRRSAHSQPREVNGHHGRSECLRNDEGGRGAQRLQQRKYETELFTCANLQAEDLLVFAPDCPEWNVASEPSGLIALLGSLRIIWGGLASSRPTIAMAPCLHEGLLETAARRENEVKRTSFGCQ
jgi:hypothetical protein